MSRENERKWHERFIRVAREVATWSKDPSTKTGCVIVRDRRVLTTGYNGFPPGVVDSVERYATREVKYRYIEHAERNAINQAALEGISLRGASMYVTFPPCQECARSIICVGIRAIYFPADNPVDNDPRVRDRWAASLGAADQMLLEAGVRSLRV